MRSHGNQKFICDPEQRLEVLSWSSMNTIILLFIFLSYVALVANRANLSISNAQKHALRNYASATQPKPTQAALVERFQSQLGCTIDRSYT